MSKVDAQRAMREAKFARLNAGPSRSTAEQPTAAGKAPTVEQKARAARKANASTARVADAVPAAVPTAVPTVIQLPSQLPPRVTAVGTSR